MRMKLCLGIEEKRRSGVQGMRWKIHTIQAK
ncbi:hypothetical protein EPYR_03282 [Erwinia pyrifoliae DSM 12163]|nr:hypothetical protein EPYR_03282 [Erwinia pyrifoliae DSM 12163]